MERKGAAYRISTSRQAWMDQPGNVTTSHGTVTSRAERGEPGNHFLMESVHGRTGAHQAKIEHTTYGSRTEDTDTYGAGPFRTKRRSQIAAESLANRIAEGKADNYYQRTTTEYGG